jgi:hypothetical protein
VVDLEPSDSVDEVPKIIEVSSNSEVEEFVEFEPVMEVEPALDIVRSGEVNFEDPEADKPRKKQRIEGYNSDTSDASRDFEIMDLTEDFEDIKEDLNEGKDPYMFIRDSEIESDSN